MSLHIPYTEKEVLYRRLLEIELLEFIAPLKSMHILRCLKFFEDYFAKESMATMPECHSF